MTLVTLPVRVEHGAIYTLDGTSLPESAHALLVLLPADLASTATATGQAERQRAFTHFYATVRSFGQAIHLDELTDTQLNDLVHQARTA